MADWIHGINWWLLALAVAIWWGGRRSGVACREAGDPETQRARGARRDSAPG